MIEVSEKPIELWKALQSVPTEGAGAAVHFIGTVRKEENTMGLFYECYPEMALRVLREIVQEAKKKWPTEEISVVHRHGWIEVGEPSVVIAVSSAHRKEAFEACRFVIDRIKEILPIWKREEGGRFAYAENQ